MRLIGTSRYLINSVKKENVIGGKTMRKFMKIVVAFLLVLSLGLPSATTSSSATEQWTAYPANTTGDIHKAWKVTFSDVVNSSTVSRQNVYMKKANGEPVDVTPTVNGATITVTPKEPYTVGETYTLYLHSSIKSVNEQALPNTTFRFTILSALEIAKSVAQEAKNAAEAIKTAQPVFANPYAGTKDELIRANAFAAELEKVIKAVQEKVQAAEALIKIAENTGTPVAELAGAKTNVSAAQKAINEAKKAVETAKQAIDAASISTQLAVAEVNVSSTSTVEVKIATALAYELTKADADKFRVIMDGTLLQVTDVVKSSNNDEYTLTIATDKTKYPLFGKQGILSVNNTRAVIPNSEFGYDFKAPTIEKVEALDSRHVRVTFSENMQESSASNYQIVEEKTTTPNFMAEPGAVAVLSADKKSVSLTLGDKKELAAGNYTLKASNVKDPNDNNISTNTTVDFLVTKDQLEDTTRPTLTAATYDSKNGALTVKFDEKVTIANISSFSLGGVKLTGSTITTSGEGTTYTIKVDQDEINEKLTNPLRLTLALGAVKDEASNNNALTNYDIAVAVPPKATRASYDEASKRLRVTFDQQIDMASVKPEAFTIKLGTSNKQLTNSTIVSTANTPSVVIELTKTDSEDIKKIAGKAETVTVGLKDNAVKNTVNPQVANILQDGIPLTYIEDTGKPRVAAIILTANENHNNDKIEVEFTKPMSQTSIEDASKYELEGPGLENVKLSAENTTFKTSTDQQKVTITLKGIDLQFGGKFTLTVKNVMDAEGNVLNAETQTNLTVDGDNKAPTIKSVSATAGNDEDIITIEFSEAVKEESAEEITNYTIGNLTPTTPTRTSIAYKETDSNNDGVMDKFEVVIKYPNGTLPEHGEIIVKNAVAETNRVLDLAGNSMADLTPAINVTVTDEVAPTIEKIQGRTVQGGLDEIIITFSEKIDSASAKLNKNYMLEVAGEPVDLTKVQPKYIEVKEEVVTILLDTNGVAGYQADDYALKNDPKDSNSIRIEVAGVKDINNNVFKTLNIIGKGAVSGDTTPGGLDNPETNVKVTSANTIQFVWDEELAADSLQKEDFKLEAVTAIKKNHQITAVSLDSTKKIVTLTISKSISYKEEELKLSLAPEGKFTDLAGNEIKTINAENSVAVQSLGAEYSLTGSTATKAPEYISEGDNKQISDVFKLTAGENENGEGYNINSLTFDIDMKGLIGLNNVQLMWSADEIVDKDDTVIASKGQVTALTKELTFSIKDRKIANSSNGYFYLTAKVQQNSSGEVEVAFKNAQATTTNKNFVVTFDAENSTIGNTKVTIDTILPTVTFNRIDSSKLTIVVDVTEKSPLVSAEFKGVELNNGSKYADLFTIVGSTSADIIKSVTYNVDTNGKKKFTIETNKGLPPGVYISLLPNKLMDAAGNPLASTLVAQGNGTDRDYSDPNELMNALPYDKDIIQYVTGSVTYGPESDEKTLSKSVTILGNTEGTITLRNLTITGDLIINTPNASVIVDSSVTVKGTTEIKEVSPGTFTNNGMLNKVKITDSTGTRFINNANGTVGDIEVVVNNANAQVKLGGKLGNIKVSNPANIEIESNATVTTINVGENIITEITNKGTVKKLAGEGTAVENGKLAESYDVTIGKKSGFYAIQNARTVNEIEAALKNYATALNLSLTHYNALGTTYQAGVNQVIFDERTSFTDVVEIKDKFEKEVTIQTNKKSSDEAINKAKNLISDITITSEINLLDALNNLYGMNETGVTLALKAKVVSNGAEINTDGYIVKGNQQVLIDVTIIISKAGETTAEKLIKVTIPAKPKSIIESVGIDVAANKIIGTTWEMQYSLDSTNGSDGTWKDATATNTTVEFKEVMIVYIREKDNTAIYKKLAEIPKAEAAPNVTLDITSGKTTNTLTTQEYSVDGGTTWTPFTSANQTLGEKVVKELTSTNGFKVRKKATATTVAGNVQTIDIPAEVVLDDGSVDGATAGDNKITGLTAGKKYVVTSSGKFYAVLADGTLSEAQTTKASAEASAVALTGIDITGLTNGTAYKVEEVVPKAVASTVAAGGATFDKNAAAGVAVEVTFGENAAGEAVTLSKVVVGESELTLAVDYTISGTTLTIGKEALAALDLTADQDLTVTLTFSDGTTATFKIAVTDSTV